MEKTCKQCSAPFEITAEDLAFYDRVSQVFNDKIEQIPLPTFCPECRWQRRMCWRNDRSFYHRKCDLSGKQFISIYPTSTPFPVYQPSEWYSDKWNPLDYGRPFDFSQPFFKQWQELMHVVPRLGIDIVNCENSDFCNYCGDDKNCYLDIAGEANEDSYFNLFTKYSKNCLDCTFVYRSTCCYECIQCHNCYNCKHSMYLEDCSDCAFCFDCKGCKNCLLSTNLRNQEYYILNKPHTKEEYEQKCRELKLCSNQSMVQTAKIWQTNRMANGVYRDMFNTNSEHCTGNDILHSKNCLQCYNIVNCEDCTHVYDVLDAKDCGDLNYSLYKPEVCYELISTLAMKFSNFCMASHYNSNAVYCDLTNNSSNLFGCIGLNQAKYCILNKQYTKEEYEALVPKMIEKMRADSEWGEFFPVSMSPFGYNETVAQEYFPLSKAEVLQRGWKWHDEEEAKEQYMGPAYAVPDSITDVTDDITKQILKCAVSGKPYKIIPQELKFYREMNIPIPRRCPDQRHKDRMALRNPRKLWKRQCAKCQAAIETTYAPDRPEIVYCEQCYLSTVY